MTDADYEDYYGKKVKLLVDGRGYDLANYSSDASVSLAIEGKITGENFSLLKLEDLCVLNRDTRFNAKRGSVTKKHILALFEQNECEVDEK